MTFKVEVFPDRRYAHEAAARIAAAIPPVGSIALTGGSTAEKIYAELGPVAGDWSQLVVYFSDERCVPPDDERSNYAMARRLLLERVGLPTVHRMRGEDPPSDAAAAYDRAITATVGGGGFKLLLLGMGADCHICALYPGSPALRSRRLCEAVERPDGLTGLTLTRQPVIVANQVLLLVSGVGKADAVRRVVKGTEPVGACPARLLVGHHDATFLLDEAAASEL